METLNLACGLLFAKVFQKNWSWVDVVISDVKAEYKHIAVFLHKV